MKDRFASSFPLVVLILLGALTLWLSRVIQSDNPLGPSRHDPDYRVERFKVRQFDVEGKLKNTLQAEKMEHFPDDDTTLVTTPHMTYHRTPPSEVFAASATLSQDGKILDLRDKVRIVRHGASNAIATVLETETLRLFPDDELGHTDDPVRLTQGQSIVTGHGLDINNKSGITVMRGRVNGTLYRNTN